MNYFAPFVIIIMSLPLAFYTLYYFVISLFALAKVPHPPKSEHLARFGLVIAARNEDKVIGKLIRSLQAMDYPDELYEIIVIPNNCTDQTEEVSRQAGATIFHVQGEVRSKGDALHYFFREMIRDKRFDAYCLFDADNLVEKDFLRYMNDQVAAGMGACRGFLDSKNPYSTATASCYTLYYYCLNRLYSHSRAVLGKNSIINGTGFMIRHDLLHKLGGWNTVTITEDIEISVLCALEGVPIGYEPRARVYDEPPSRIQDAWRQRLRWSTGSQQGFEIYAKPLLDHLRRGQGKDVFDTLLMLLVTYMQVGVVLLFLLSRALLPFQTEEIRFMILVAYVMGILNMILIPTFVAVFTLILERKPIRPMFKGILTFWFFLVSWLPTNIIVAFRKSTEWKPIEHSHSIDLEDVPKKEK